MKIRHLLTKGYEILKSSHIDSYIIDSQLILQSILNKDKVYLITNMDEEVNNESVQKFMELIQLRKRNMPVKYIIGKCEFMGIDFKVYQGTLIPRPDTEVLVNEVLEVLKINSFKNVCDVGCGTGAIGISLAYYSEGITVDCFDISEAALKNTEENIMLNNVFKRVRVVQSDLLRVPIEQGLRYDVIVSNPPYIKEKDIESLMSDVKDYEPLLALSGGEDGLDFYRRITKQAEKCLKPHGYICFEIGYDQMETVGEILKRSNFQVVKGVKDLAGLDRVIIAKGNFL